MNNKTRKEAAAEKNFKEGAEFYEKKKYPAAVASWNKAAKCGHLGAKYYLGICYEKNLGVGELSKEERLAVAEYWWKQGAEEGDRRASNALFALRGYTVVPKMTILEVEHMSGPHRPHHSKSHKHKELVPFVAISPFPAPV